MPDAALMIDWENFYAGREDNAGELFDIGQDLVQLSDLALELVHQKDPALRLAVRRAYADFNARRRTRTNPEQGSQLFMHRTPRQLMDHGVEPVQVFRFPGGSSKNAADMRLAVDALRLMSDGRGLDMLVIVTGDADFIPLAIDLRRMGAFVAVIGIANHTKQIFQRYVDRFELFEDLVAARSLGGDADEPLALVSKALQSILRARSSVVFAAVRPLLNHELDRPFDPGRFGADNMGDFLRRYADELGIRVQRGENDWELALAGSTRSSPPKPPGNDSAVAAAQPASASLYMRVLERTWPKFFLPPVSEWHRIIELVTDAFAAQRARGITAPTPSVLLEEVVDTSEQEGMEEAERKVKAVMFQCLSANVFRDPRTGESIADARPERWEEPVTLAAADAVALDQSIRQMITHVLAARLGKREGDPVLEAEALAQLLDGPESTPEQVVAAGRLIAALD